MVCYADYIDEELLLLLSQSDEGAFEAIYKKYWLPLYNTGWKYLRDTDQAKDLVQDIFTKLWSNRSGLKIGNLQAYLHTAVRYGVINLAAHGKVEENFYRKFAQLCDVQYHHAENPLVEKELKLLLQKYVAALPAKRRDIFTLYMEEQLSTKEIAQQLNLSTKTVQNQLLKAQKAMIESLSPSVSLLILFLIK